MQRIVIGTAQWGLDYGITNTNGRLEENLIEEIVDLSVALGISKLDTASVYGDSEKRISKLGRDFSVQTKIVASTPSGKVDSLHQLEQSLETLSRSEVESCLIWDWGALSRNNRFKALEGLSLAKKLKLTNQIGVSIYNSDEFADVIDFEIPVDLVQVPISILDQRLLNDEWVERLIDFGVKFQARSVFLQGVTLGGGNSIHELHPDVVRLKELHQSLNVSAVDLSLDFIKRIPWIHEVILAPTSRIELAQLVSAMNAPLLSGMNFENFASKDFDLIDPRRWGLWS